MTDSRGLLALPRVSIGKAKQDMKFTTDDRGSGTSKDSPLICADDADKNQSCGSKTLPRINTN
jgi:hypothetical protein